MQPAIDDLIEFMARNDAPPLAQAAVAHAQFVTIHPFPDGNGRTGRALIHAMLRGKGLTRQASVPISAGLLADTGRYFDALSAYRDGNVDPIVEQMCEASYVAIGNGRQLAADLREVRDGWADRIKARKDSTVWKVADLRIQRR